MSTPQSRFWLTMIAVFAGNFAAILSSTTIVIPLPYLMATFATDLSTISWAVTGFTLATGVIAPTTGYLCDRFGVRNTYLGAMAVFLLTSFLCAAAWHVHSLIAFRFLQGLFAGIMIPVTMTIIYYYVPKNQQAFAISMWSMSGVLAPALGPTIAGVIIEYFHWRWIFLMNVPITAIAILLTWRYMRADQAPPTPSTTGLFDRFGFLSGTIGTTLLLVTFSFSKNWGIFDHKTLGLTALGVATLVVFIRHELTCPNPLLNFKVLSYKSFAIGSYSNVFITIILNCSIFILPLYLQTVRGYSPLETGLIVLIGPIAVAIVSPIVGKIYRRSLAKAIALIGILGMTIGFVLLSLIQEDTTVFYIMLAILILEAFMGAAKIPAMNYGMEILPRTLTAHGSAITSWLKQCTSSLIVGVITTLILLRTNAHLTKSTIADPDLAYTHAFAAGSIDIFHLAILGSILFFCSMAIVMQPQRDDLPTD